MAASEKNEVKEKWGETSAYNEYIEKTKNYSNDRWNSIIEGMNNIFALFALCVKNNEEPNSTTAQELVSSLQNFITNNFYNCTNDILFGLGQMYILDERFKNNIDKHCAGTAGYVFEAIKIYCKK